MRQGVARFLAACLLAAAPLPAFTQSYPSKPVRIVASAAGGGADFTARLLAGGLREPLGQQVIVDNRPGLVAIDVASKATPDGYTLLFYSGALWLLPFLGEKIEWDPVRDFESVIWLTQSPNILVVHPSLPVRSVKELIALAKARPGELNYGAGSIGSPLHLSAELFKSLAGVDIVRVSYKGTAPVLTALVGGEVQLVFSTPGPAAPHIQSGRLRPLAMTAGKPSELLPGIPTMAAAGVPGYEAISIQGIFAPAKVPAAIVQRLYKDMSGVLARPDIKASFLKVGSEVVGGTPEQLNQMRNTEIAKWGKVLKPGGVQK